MTLRQMVDPRTSVPELPVIEDIVRRGLLTSALAVTLYIMSGDGEIRAGEATRRIATEFGDYDIPSDPRRLFLMGNRYELEVARALGLSPIGMGQEYVFRGGAVEYVAPWVPFNPSSVEQVLQFAAPDVESILALDPDLIFAVQFWFSPDWIEFETLNAIAPVIPMGALPWREDLDQVATWLGRESQLSATLREFDTLKEAIKANRSERIDRDRVIFGSYESPNTIYLVNEKAENVPAREALVALGGHQVPLTIGDDDFSGWNTISMENMRLIENADLLLIWAPDEKQRAELLAHPLWPLLPNVQKGHALVTTNNMGWGALYTITECMRLWDEAYSLLG